MVWPFSGEVFPIKKDLSDQGEVLGEKKKGRKSPHTDILMKNYSSVSLCKKNKREYPVSWYVMKKAAFLAAFLLKLHQVKLVGYPSPFPVDGFTVGGFQK